MVNLIRKRKKSEPVALLLSGDAKEQRRRDRAVQVSGHLVENSRVSRLWNPPGAEPRSVKGQVDFLGALQLENFRHWKPSFGRRFPIDLVEAVPALVLSQFLKFASSADLRLSVHPDGAAVQKVRDLFSFDSQVWIDTNFTMNRSVVAKNPESQRGMPIKIKAVQVVGSTGPTSERDAHDRFG